jgi:transcriptional regulator with XRE-family HTH domain
MQSQPSELPPLPANRMRELLAARGLRLIDVAALCRVDQSTAWRWQQNYIPQQHLPAIARLLGVSIPYLAGYTDEKGREIA